MKSNALGRGFSSLIPTDLVDEEFDPTANEDDKLSKLILIPLDQIDRDESQPRKRLSEDALTALANSIKANGVLQPIVVTKESAKGQTRYKIVAGERRFRASQKAGLSSIPAIVRTLTAQKRLEISIIENAQREDLNAIELATAYAKLRTQFNLSDAEISAKIGKSTSAVGNTLRLLNLPDFAKKAMLDHNLSEGVMRPLISQEPEVIQEVLDKILTEGWTSRRVESYVKSLRPRSAKEAQRDVDYGERAAEILTNLTQKHFQPRRVKISARSITISFQNQKDLENYLNKL